MQRVARAIDTDGYDRWVGVTLAGPKWRANFARLRGSVVRKVGAWEWAYVRERGPKTGMLHIHAVVKGPWLDAPVWTELAQKHGFGRNTDIGAPWGSKAGYAAKAAEYAGKAHGGWWETLALNDGRPWHASHGYMRPWGMRAYVQRFAPDPDPGPWINVHARDVPKELRDPEREQIRRELYFAQVREELDRGADARIAAQEAEDMLRVQLDATPVPDLAGERRRSLATDHGNAFHGFGHAQWSKRRAEWLADCV